MLKSNKGVTIIALVTTIVILIILTGVSLTAGYSSLEKVRVGRIITNMTLVKAKADNLYEEYQFSNDETILGEKSKISNLNVTLSDVEKTLIQNAALENKNISSDLSNWDWYLWNKEKLQEQGLDSKILKNNEVFYVNYESGEVLYSTGTVHDNNGEKTNYYSFTGLNNILED